SSSERKQQHDTARSINQHQPDASCDNVTAMESATNTGNLVREGPVAPATPGGEGAVLGEAAARPFPVHRSLAAVIRDYLALTKPRIIGLLLVTTVATMFVADPSGPSLETILWTVLGGYLAAGGAGAINHYLE